MLVQLGELPVYWVDVHVVVLLKVLRQQLNRVIPGMQPPLALKDFLHLRDRGEQTFLSAFPHRLWGGGWWVSPRGDRFKGCGVNACYFETLFGSEEAGGGGVVLVELQQHVFQPVAHPQRELDQLGVHARGNDWRDGEKRQRFVRHLKTTQRPRLTFARAGVVQVEPVSPLRALQVAFRRKELTGRVVRLVVRPAHLRKEGQDDGERRRKPPARLRPPLYLHCRSRSRWGDIPTPAGTHTPAYCRHRVYTSFHAYRGSWCTDLKSGNHMAMTPELYSWCVELPLRKECN